MIKFFRHIRQRLIAESKFSKYLLYAIGEIILVVIGILIALSINNWNENRKNRNLEANYISRLIVDLEETENYINSYIHYNSQVMDRAKKSVEYFYDPLKAKDIPIESLVDLYQASQISDALSPNSTYQELIASGQINLLRDENIKQTLIAYYELRWNESVIITLPNKYRDNLRSNMPHDIQEQIRKNCGDIYLGTKRSITVKLPEKCDIRLDEDNAKTVLTELLNDAQLKKDLVFLLGNLDSKLAYMGYVLQQLNGLKSQLKK